MTQTACLLEPETAIPLRAKTAEEAILALRRSFICGLNQLLDLKDLNTGIHSTRLAEWAVHVACELGFEQSALPDIEAAALLHDIGKIGIPDAILNKPSRLTREEYELMKRHSEYGWIVLRQIPVSSVSVCLFFTITKASTAPVIQAG